MVDFKKLRQRAAFRKAMASPGLAQQITNTLSSGVTRSRGWKDRRSGTGKDGKIYSVSQSGFGIGYTHLDGLRAVEDRLRYQMSGFERLVEYHVEVLLHSETFGREWSLWVRIEGRDDPFRVRHEMAPENPFRKEPINDGLEAVRILVMKLALIIPYRNPDEE